MSTPTEIQEAQNSATIRLREHTETLYGLFFRTRPPATPAYVQERLSKEGLEISLEELSQWKKEREKIEEDARKFFVLIEDEFRKLMPFVTKEQGRLMLIRFIMLEAAVKKDGKLALQAVDREQAELDGERKDRSLDQQDFKNSLRLERFEWEKQIKEVLNSTKNEGCITQATLEKIERELKLL